MKFSFQELQEENRILNRTVKRQGLELERLLGAEGELERFIQELYNGGLGGYGISIDPEDRDMTLYTRKQNRKALRFFRRTLDRALLALHYGYDLAACDKLEDALERADGDPTVEDWFQGEIADLLAEEILGLQALIGCP